MADVARPALLSLTHTNTLSLSHTPSLSHTHPLSNTLSLTHTHSQNKTHTHTLSLSLSHTHTPSHTDSMLAEFTRAVAEIDAEAEANRELDPLFSAAFLFFHVPVSSREREKRQR